VMTSLREIDTASPHLSEEARQAADALSGPVSPLGPVRTGL
jgi:hypothetical protein